MTVGLLLGRGLVIALVLGAESWPSIVDCRGGGAVSESIVT